jgi:hypothetical protein
MKYGGKRFLKIGLFFLSVALIVFLWFLFVSQTPPQKNKNTQNTGYRYAKPIQSITGFEYTQNLGSKRLVSITSRHFAIQRKKLGFLRFALMKEAVFSDALIKLYLYPEEKKDNSPDIVPPITEVRSEDIVGSLEILMAKDSKLVSTLKNVSTIIIHPVRIEFYFKAELVLSISAMSGNLGVSDRKVFFTRNVVVISGDRKMVVDRLELNPDTRVLMGTDYVFYAPEGETSGNHITTDFNLRKVYE